MSRLKKEYHYPLDLGLDLIGGKWKLRILYHLASGTKRFGELKTVLTDLCKWSRKYAGQNDIRIN